MGIDIKEWSIQLNSISSSIHLHQQSLHQQSLLHNNTVTSQTPTFIMTTNSFGGPLPPFDFPAQPAPAVSRMARVSKALPIVLVTASVVGKFLTHAAQPIYHTNLPQLSLSRLAKSLTRLDVLQWLKI
jgi:hypothetical protein